MNFRVSVVAAVFALTAIGALAQQPANQPAPSERQRVEGPVFRAEVDAIELDAFVTDASGNPVTDLTADDFEITEAGKVQPITSFALVNIPIEKAERPLYSPRTIEPDVRTNTNAEGRVYLIAIDDIVPTLVPRTRLFLRRFLEQHFAANDVAALVYIGRGNSKNTQDFTSNRRLLLEAVDKIQGDQPAGDLLGTAAPGADPESELRVRMHMKNFRNLAEFTAKMHGRRKSMLLMTNGLGTSVFEALDYAGGTKSIELEDLHAAITAATRGDVSIYPIDPAGLTGDVDASSETPVPRDAGRELTRVQDLRALAEATGGFSVTNTNSFDEAFTRIVRENSTYYVLGFSAPAEKRDGRFHKVQVRVKRPGLQVRTRDGYLAPLRAPTAPPVRLASALPEAIGDALASPVAVSTLPMRVFAAPFKGNDKSATVAMAIEVDAERLGLQEENGAHVGTLIVTASAVSAGGKVTPGARHEGRLTLRPETFERAKATGVRVLSQMTLQPGRYQIRVAGGTRDGRAGSVLYDIEIPDFTKDPLVLGGVALTSDRAAAAPTLKPVDPLGMVLQTPIVATREFAQGETVTLYAEVYENGRPAAHTLDFKVDLRTDEGRVLSTFTEQRSSKELSGARGGYGFIAPIRLADVAPGIYVLHVEARANTKGLATVTRDIQIRVK